jgi:adhesin transport system outer membrane protein
MRIKILRLTLTVFLFLSATQGYAITLNEAAQQAVLNNPDVQLRWSAFKGAVAQQDAARGGYYPRVDVAASTGRERLTQPNQPDSSFSRQNVTASLSQLLFDGFATRNEVRRQGYNKLSRYFDLLDASETTALDASRAYYDVLRYRKLVKLAEENYAQHKVLFDLMEQRAKVGVGRRVDFEQAGGRLALAESNLLTEISNLHDVSARYQRIVGVLPPTEMAEPELLQKGLPGNVNAALEDSIRTSPVIASAIEGIRAAQSDLSGRNAAYSPRVDLRARQSLDKNLDGVLGNRNDSVLEVVLNYNLFRGGSDSALKRQAAESLNASKDLRDKACRDVRQTLEIAYNDTQRIAEQLRYLNAHQLSTEKARDAYRKQFDIGQRTLLDLLDTENELFQARRAYVIAVYDRGIAFARTHAAIGTLLQALSLNHVETPSIAEMGDDRYEVDPATACPAEAPSMMVVDKAEAAARAAAANPVVLPTPVVKPEPKPPVVSDEEQLQQALQAWASAWKAKNAGAYLAFYSPEFVPAGGVTRDAWVRQRRDILARKAEIELNLENIKVRLLDKNQASIEFRQSYRAGSYQDVVNKTLHWQREDGRWLITREALGK